MASNALHTKSKAVVSHCVWCGRAFRPKQKLGRKPLYCSDKCKGASDASARLSKPEIGVCQKCGQEFPQLKMGAPRKYCYEC